MATAQWFASKNSGSNAPNTFYCTLPCGHLAVSTTESVVQAPSRASGVFSKLYTRVTVNDRTSTSTMTFRTGGSDGNQSISIGAGLTGDFMDSSDTDTVAGSGELINIKLIIGTGGTTYTWALAGILFAADSGTLIRLEALGANTTVNSGQTQYQALAGLGSTDTTEANEQHKIRLTGTLRHLFANIATNNLITATTTIRTRKGGANGGMSVSIGAGLTGVFEDTTNTDSVAAGDLVNSQTVTSVGGGGNITYGNIGCSLLDSSGNQYQLICATNAGLSVSQNTTTYMPPSGALSASTTEDSVKGRTNEGLTTSKLQVFVVSNSIAASTTFRTRKSGANGNQSITIGSTLTGFFEDASNTDSYAVNDYMGYQIVTGASGSNTIKINSIGVLVSPVQTLSPSGLASTLGIGTDKLNPKITTTGLASTLGIGTDKLNPTIFMTGKASSLGIGEPGVLQPNKISPGGLASTLAIGTDQINLRILGTGKASTLQIGSDTLTSIAYILPSGRASTVGIGTDKLIAYLVVSGCTSGLAIGIATVFAAGVIGPSGRASTIAIGSATLTSKVTLVVTGRASTIGIGTDTLTSIAKLLPTGRASTLIVGSDVLTSVAHVVVSGLGSAPRIGSPIVTKPGLIQVIAPVGLSSKLRIGQPFVIALLGCLQEWQELPVIGPSEFQAEHRAPEPPSGVSGWD